MWLIRKEKASTRSYSSEKSVPESAGLGTDYAIQMSPTFRSWPKGMKSFRNPAALACLGLSLLPVVGRAQVAAKPAATTLPGVVVTATRRGEDALLVPAAIDVIDAADIQRAQPRIHLSESLQRVPGVVARDRQNYAQDLQISIRGFGARSTFGVRGVRLYTDGIPATMPDGQGQVSHFALDAAQRIEVLRGPFSALYGNSSGGVIALYSADAPAQPTLGLELDTGSHGMSRTSASWRTRWGVDDVGSLDAGLSHLETEGFRRHSRAQRTSGQVSFKGAMGRDGNFTLLANTLDLQADDPQGLTAAELSGDRRSASPGALNFDTRKSVAQQQAGARLEHVLSGQSTVSFTSYLGRRRTQQMLSVPVAAQTGSPLNGGGAIDLDRDYHGVDARWRGSADLAGAPVSVTAGVEYEVSDERRLGFENFSGASLGVVGALRRDEDNRVSGLAFYAQADWQPGDRWRFNVGLRNSRVRFDSRDAYITALNPDDSGGLEYRKTTPVAGILFRLSPTASLYANAGSGFETPTFAELAYRNDGLSGLNTRLRAARSNNVEFGFRSRREGSAGRGRREISAAVFESRTRDELVVVSNLGGRSTFGNAGASRRRGAEFSFSNSLADRWHLAANYTYLEARYVGGRDIPGLSRHQAWAELRFSPDANLDLLLEARLVGRIFANDANTAAAPGHSTFDLGLERRLEFSGLDWRAFARLNNLLDRDVIGSVIVNDANGRYFEPAPGRNWVVGIHATRSFK